MPALARSSAEPDTAMYARDLWPRHLIRMRGGTLPDTRPGAVVWPRSEAEVVELVELARREGFELVPFGAGSGVCGGIEPSGAAVVVDMKRFDDFWLDEAGPTVHAGAGVLGITLEEELERRGYTSGHFPSSIICSTVGGWAAARSAGQCSGRYGKIEDMVSGLRCVLGTGDALELSRRFTAGPDLIPLLVGSEGTLGVITRVSLRLHPQPKLRLFRAFTFPDVEHGFQALRAIYQRGLRPAVARLYDPLDSALQRFGKKRKKSAAHPPEKRSARSALLRRVLGAPSALKHVLDALERHAFSASNLILVIEGGADEAHADCRAIERVSEEIGGRALGEAPARAWFSHRYSVSYRQSPVFRSGAFSDTMEVAAPWSKLRAVYDSVRDALGRHALVLAHMSHAYPDGCSIYFTFVGAAKDDTALVARYDAAWRDALSAALAAGASLSHHHGVGRSKAFALGAELGTGARLVTRMQRAWDPSGCLNPGALSVSSSEAAPSASARVTDPRAVELDAESELASLPGDRTLGELETELAARGFSLPPFTDGLVRHGACKPEQTLAEWIAEGMPGAQDPWSDPVDHTLAGMDADFGSGEPASIRACPRRAVGPDLTALVVGARGRLGSARRAVVRVHPISGPRARPMPYRIERDPPPSADEMRAFDALVRGLGKD